MIEGSGSGSIPLTSGSGSGRPRNIWIRWIRIFNTVRKTGFLVKKFKMLAGDGVLLLVHVGEVPPRAAELHRPAGDVHPREAEADQAHHHLLPVLQRGQRHPPLHRCRCQRFEDTKT